MPLDPSGPKDHEDLDSLCIVWSRTNRPGLHAERIAHFSEQNLNLIASFGQVVTLDSDIPTKIEEYRCADLVDVTQLAP